MWEFSKPHAVTPCAVCELHANGARAQEATGRLCLWPSAPPHLLLGMGRTGQADLISSWSVLFTYQNRNLQSTRVLTLTTQILTAVKPGRMALGFAPRGLGLKGLWACARHPLGPALAPASAHHLHASWRLPTRSHTAATLPRLPHRTLLMLGAVPVPQHSLCSRLTISSPCRDHTHGAPQLNLTSGACLHPSGREFAEVSVVVAWSVLSAVNVCLSST